MTKAERFEDLIAWQKARELTRAIYEVTTQGGLARDLGLAGQLRRAAVSAMSNVAEGFDRDGMAEFHRFLTIAKASCGETRSLLYVALDVGYIDDATFDRLKDRTDEAARVINGLRTAVARRRDQQRSGPSRT